MDTFPFVEVPPEMAEIVGKREGDSRVYAMEGTEEDCSRWFDAVHEIAGPCVSPGGVTMFCPVSRAATHRRMREGRLTCFTYHVTERKFDFFGKLRASRETPYAHVPVSECKAWRAELEEKAIRNERLTREDLEGEEPDWDAEFLKWDSRWRKEQRKLGGPRTIEMTIKLSPKENEMLERAAAKSKHRFASKEEMVSDWINFTTMQGLSGLSFIKLGFRFARFLEEYERLSAKKK